MNKVWIELVRPTSEEGDEAGRVRAELANKMMRKLGFTYDVFSWMPSERSYIRFFSDNAGFVYMTDNGEWFNLDWVAK